MATGRPADLRTGEWLFESTLKPIANKYGPFAIEFLTVVTKEEFLSRLQYVQDKYITQGHCPILHFETHGDDSGLELGSGERIAWEELREPLTRMNEVVGVNLLIVSALCNGAHLSTVLNPTMPAPAWGVIGPRNDVKAGPLREAMAEFYRVLFSTLDVRRAMDAMNGFAAYGEWEYKLETAEVMLFRVYKHILERYSKPEQMLAQENEIVAEVVRRHGYDIHVGMQARLRAKELLGDHEKYYTFFRRSFLMIDRFPENDARFTLSFADCAGIASGAA
jgi:hypothetical protein